MTQNTRAWKLRPGSDDAIIRNLLKTGIVTLDYGVPNLSLDMDKDKLRLVLREADPDISDKRVSAHAGQLLTLLIKIKKNDFLLVPRDRGKNMIIGKVLSSPPSINGSKISLRAKWLQEAVPISTFEQDLQYSFMAIMKLCEVKRNNAVTRISEIATGKPDPGY